MINETNFLSTAIFSYWTGFARFFELVTVSIAQRRFLVNKYFVISITSAGNAISTRSDEKFSII